MALLDDPLDEVVLHIDVLHARVILVVLGESYGRLIVTEDVHWLVITSAKPDPAA